MSVGRLWTLVLVFDLWQLARGVWTLKPPRCASGMLRLAAAVRCRPMADIMSCNIVHERDNFTNTLALTSCLRTRLSMV